MGLNIQDADGWQGRRHIVTILQKKELHENSAVREYLATASHGKNYSVIY